MEQNRKRYSSLAKAIVIGLQMIAAVVASVSIVLFSTCVNQNMLNMGDLQNSSFVESGYFERTFSKQMMQLLDYLNLREAFETDGVFDENRPETVNASPEKIADYKVYNNKYDQNNTNVYYWLGDLRDNTYVTNMKETKTQEDAYDQAVKYGRYLSYNNKTFRFETNIGGMENNYYQNMAQYNELQKGDFRDGNVFSLTWDGLKLFSTVFVFIGLNVFLSGYFTALGNGFISAVISLLRSLFLVVIFILVLPKLIGVSGVWLTMPMSEAVTIFIAIYLYRTYGKHFMKEK